MVLIANPIEPDVETNLVVDKDGTVLLWSNDRLLMLKTLTVDRVDMNYSNMTYNSRPINLSASPQLFVGFNGALFAAASSTVNFLSPKPGK
jgi:hypothetical protein